MTFDEPSGISVSKKSNEANISSIKSYLSNLADNLNYLSKQVEDLQDRVATLESEDE